MAENKGGFCCPFNLNGSHYFACVDCELYAEGVCSVELASEMFEACHDRLNELLFEVKRIETSLNSLGGYFDRLTAGPNEEAAGSDAKRE